MIEELETLQELIDELCEHGCTDELYLSIETIIENLISECDDNEEEEILDFIDECIKIEEGMKVS